MSSVPLTLSSIKTGHTFLPPRNIQAMALKLFPFEIIIAVVALSTPPPITTHPHSYAPTQHASVVVLRRRRANDSNLNLSLTREFIAPQLHYKWNRQTESFIKFVPFAGVLWCELWRKLHQRHFGELSEIWRTSCGQLSVGSCRKKIWSWIFNRARHFCGLMGIISHRGWRVGGTFVDLRVYCPITVASSGAMFQ